jgi:iron complex outermembrane receptor protein
LTDNNNLKVPSWQVLDLRAAYKFNFPKWVIQLQLGIKNIAGEHYPSMVLINAPSLGGNNPRYYYPGMNRNYYLALLVGF